MASTSTNSNSVGVSLSRVFGPIYWGFFISVLLGGISILQAYIYFFRTKDRPSVRLTAACMIILDMISSALVAQSVYYYLVPHFGSTMPLKSITTELSVECLISTTITFISQLYFVEQIMRWSRIRMSSRYTADLVTAAVVAASAILAFAFGIACTASMIIHKHGVLEKHSLIFSVFFGLAKGFGTLTDVIATIAMCFSLSSSKTGFEKTNWIINTLVQFFIHRGILVTLVQALLLITFFAIPSSLAWLAFHINVTKLYVNVFFAMLNSRDNLAERLGQDSIVSLGNLFQVPTRHDVPQWHTRGNISEGYSGIHQVEVQYPIPAITKPIIIPHL